MARVNHDIEYDSTGGEGQDRRGRAGRLLASGQDPLRASFSLARLGGVRVRVHWIVPLYAVCELAAGLAGGARLEFVSALVGALLALVVVREVVRGLFAQRLGSTFGSVTVWPLGGLNSVGSPGVMRPAACESGGLLTSLVLIPLLAGAAVAEGLEPRLLYQFNPLNPGEVLRLLGSWWLVALWSAYYVNAVLLVLNLLPMFPMDMGRIMAAGTNRGRVARAGMFCAVALIVVSTFVSARLMGLAAFGFIACLIEARRMEFLTDEEPDRPSQDPVDEPPGTAPEEPRATEDLDRVLEKISREGMPSLTLEDRDVLSRETERRRRG